MAEPPKPTKQLRKRGPPTEEPAGAAARESKRAKPNPAPKQGTRFAGKPGKGAEPRESSMSKRIIARNSPGVATHGTQAVKSNEKKEMDYTAEEVCWIRFHYYQLNFAVKNRSATACKDTTSCTYFNAYFEGHIIEGHTADETGKPTHNQQPDVVESESMDVDPPTPAEKTRSKSSKQDPPSPPTYPKRAFKDFHTKCQQMLETTLSQIQTASDQNRRIKDAKEFRPIISPSCLKAYRALYAQYSDNCEFNWGSSAGSTAMLAFLGNVVDQQLAPYKPTWVADGTRNVLGRPALSLGDYTARHMGELDHEPSALRGDWHQDYSARQHAFDAVLVAHGETDAPESFRWRWRKVHADIGNALLNMAVLRPAGFGGDLNELVTDSVELPEMGAQQRRELEEHLEAVRAGDALRKRVFDEAVWPPEGKDTDEAARVAVERKADGASVDQEP